MKKLLLSFALIFMMSIPIYAYTASYECKDRKDTYVLWVNIDQNSLHFRDSNKTFLFNYDETVNAKDKKNVLVHFFRQKNYHQSVYQAKTNPIEIYVDDYKDNKLRYEYECKLKHIIKDKNGIPITWRTIQNKEKLLEDYSEDSPRIQNKEKAN